jgi:hypothetical protein
MKSPPTKITLSTCYKLAWPPFFFPVFMWRCLVGGVEVMSLSGILISVYSSSDITHSSLSVQHTSLLLQLFGSTRYIKKVIVWMRLVATYTGLFISPSGISEIDRATAKTDTAERSISIGRESLQVFFCIRGLGLRHISWVFLQGTTMPSLRPINAAVQFGTWALHWHPYAIVWTLT